MQALDLNLDHWLAHISSQHWQTIDMGLDRMQAMVARMQLQRPAPKTITVAGTNGKGSTCMACETFLLARGLSVGTTLSPHIERFNERIRVNGKEADDASICQAFAKVEAHRYELPLTYFEFSALAALWLFKQAQVDVAILEIGLGGTMDAFNVIDADVAVITSIGLDHEAFLGDNMEDIGAEKAGILRADQYVVLGPDLPASVARRATELSLDPLVLGERWALAVAADGQSWCIKRGQEVVLADIPMGQFAPQNILLAYLAVQGVAPVALEVLREIASRLSMPGRMQRLMVKNRTWLLDVAHNPAGAQFLVNQLKQRQIEPQAIVCGMFADKDHAGVFNALREAFDVSWFLVDTDSERGLSAGALQRKLPSKKGVHVVSWNSLLEEVSSATHAGDVILVLGSFNVIEKFNQQVCALPH